MIGDVQRNGSREIGKEVMSQKGRDVERHERLCKNVVRWWQYM